MNKEMGPFEHLDTTIYLVFSPISSHLVAIPGPKLFNKITTYERSLAAKYIFVREIKLEIHAMLVLKTIGRKENNIPIKVLETRPNCLIDTIASDSG